MSERRIKVLLASALPPPMGGITTWTKRILAAPADPDIDRVHVDTSSGSGFIRRRGPHVGQLILIARVSRRILVERPDVFHITTSYGRGWSRDALFLAFARRLGAKTIVNIRGGDFGQIFDAASPRRQSKILRQLSRCDAVVAITEESVRHFRSLGLNNVRLIPNCVDVRPLSPAPFHSPIRWLYVGALIPSKGVKEMFDALRRFPGAHLTLVGPIAIVGAPTGQPLVDEVERDRALASRCTFVGEVTAEEARMAYRQHDIFIFPSKREGFPNSVLEAMEAGMPIVATRVGALPDMIIDRDHGLLVPAGDQPALEEAIRSLMSNPERAAALGASARARASTLYDVNRVAGSWCQLYRDLVTRGRANGAR